MNLIALFMIGCSSSRSVLPLGHRLDCSNKLYQDDQSNNQLKSTTRKCRCVGDNSSTYCSINSFVVCIKSCESCVVCFSFHLQLQSLQHTYSTYLIFQIVFVEDLYYWYNNRAGVLHCYFASDTPRSVKQSAPPYVKNTDLGRWWRTCRGLPYYYRTAIISFVSW